MESMDQPFLKPIWQDSDLLVVDKPCSFNTHRADIERTGLCEIFSEALGTELLTVQRLDKETSGVLLFAKNKATAEQWSELFREHQVHKRYLFLTAEHSDFDSVTHESLISPQGKKWHSDSSSKKPNATTHFKRLKRSPFFTLWEARPITGKTHQIRLHAQDLGIPILGDTLYGGAPFPRICLHAQELKTKNHLWQSPPPPFFERMGLLKDSELINILSAIDRRQRFYQFLNNPHLSLRLLHQESPHYRIDLLGPVLWIYWYKDENPCAKDLERFQFISGFLNKKWTLRKMQNRGTDPNTMHTWGDEIPSKWLAQENDFSFEFRKDQGLSPGLFLDQKNNRHWVFKNSNKKRVLNLFSYTGGFSLYAAKGGAQQVTTVDLSKKFIEWSQSNFNLNNCDVSAHLFYSMDVFEFIKYAQKKSLVYDLIICDPPSFSRSKNGVFKIEKDYVKLIESLKNLLTPHGQLLFSSNFEAWDTHTFQSKIKEALNPKSILAMKHSWDYESDPHEALLKSFLIEFR